MYSFYPKLIFPFQNLHSSHRDLYIGRASQRPLDSFSPTSSGHDEKDEEEEEEEEGVETTKENGAGDNGKQNLLKKTEKKKQQLHQHRLPAGEQYLNTAQPP